MYLVGEHCILIHSVVGVDRSMTKISQRDASTTVDIQNVHASVQGFFESYISLVSIADDTYRIQTV